MLLAAAKTHECQKLEDINVSDLELCLIIDQTDTYLFKCFKVTSKYLKSLAFARNPRSENYSKNHRSAVYSQKMEILLDSFTVAQWVVFFQ